MKKAYTLLLAITILCFSITKVNAVAINSPNGFTPAKGQTIIRAQFRSINSSNDFAKTESETTSIPLTLVHGITEKLTGTLIVPYLNKEFKAVGALNRDTSGIGDITMMAKYRIYAKDYPAATSRLGLIAGLKFPTGDHNDSDTLGSIPRAIQVSSGSWDPIFGWAYSYLNLDYELDTSMIYKLNTEDDGFAFGDVLRYNVALQRRILPWSIPDLGTYKQLDLVLEFNGVWSQDVTVAGAEIPNTSGHVLYFSPGLQYKLENATIETSVQIPIISNFQGLQNEPDVNLVGSIRYYF